MSAFTKVLASIISVPVSIIKPIVQQVGEDMKTIEREHAAQAARSKMEMPELDDEELAMIAARRAKRAQR